MLQDLLAVWFPHFCWGCGLSLPKKQQWLCVYCQAQLPKTYFEGDKNNPLKLMMRQQLPVESAYAPFYFAQNNPIQKLFKANPKRRLDGQTVLCAVVTTPFAKAM